jgi:phospholipid/cholesterol/gamma-HCH transport system substrate-binding protein
MIEILSLFRMKISNESKVGIFTALSITVLILGYNYLKGRDLFTRTKTFHAVFSNVDGLVTSNPVMINGYRIGQVTDIEMMNQDSLRFLVSIEVQNKIPVPDNSVIKIYSADFFGGKAIELVIGDSRKMAENRSYLQHHIEPGFTDNLNQITLPLREKVKSILENLDSMLGGESGAAFRETVQKLPAAVDNLNSTLSQVDHLVATRLASIFEHTDKITSNLASNSSQINRIIDNISLVSDSLAAMNLKETVNSANKVIGDLGKVVQDIHDGKGTLGQLAQNEQLYTELRNASTSLDELLKDLKANPKRYVRISVFGGKNKE